MIEEKTGVTNAALVPAGHTGPICKGCGQPFYYDYIPERHDGSGYCWICFDERVFGVPVRP